MDFPDVLTLKSSSVLATVLESLPDGVVAFNRSGKYIFANQKTEKLLSGNEEVVEKVIINGKHLFLKDEITPVSKYDIPFMETLNGKTSTLECYFYPISKKARVLLQLNFQPLRNNETITGIVVAIRELPEGSERSPGQKKLIKQFGNNEPDQSVIMLSDLSRGIAHEIRNPLTNIKLAHEQLQVLLQKEGLEKLTGPYSSIIRNNFGRIEHVIKELIYASKPPKLILKRDKVDRAVRLAIYELEEIIQKQGVKLVKELSPEVPELMIDVDFLQSAISNVILNALESFKNGNGTIKIVIYSESGQCFIKIMDNGSGIEKQNISQIFNPFYTTRSGRLGLGLTAAKNIVESHHGEINVETREGEGTCVTISFSREGL